MKTKIFIEGVKCYKCNGLYDPNFYECPFCVGEYFEVKKG